MKSIELFDKVINGEMRFCDTGINSTMFEAYRRSKAAENNTIDFDGVIWEKDIEEIVKCLSENRIYEFTISSSFSGLISAIAEFEKLGFHMCGTTEVNAPFTDVTTGKFQRMPAIRLRG